MSMRKWLIILAWPAISNAQQVNPVLSNDYLELIRKDTSRDRRITDTVHNMNRARLVYPYYHYYYGDKIKTVRIGANNTMRLVSHKTHSLSLNGSISLNTEWQHYSRIPSLQHDYVQGRTINNTLQWQGPHTDELFSFGPSIRNLRYDGSNYAWDKNGQLVPATQGNGHAATAYNNTLLRNGFAITRSASLQISHSTNYKRNMYLLLRGSNSNERTLVPLNRNRVSSYSVLLNNTMIRNLELSASFQRETQHYTQSNRTGLISRAYQFSLLSPVSFDIRQGTYIGNNQRSYSRYADNPFFLLDDPAHGFGETRVNTGYTINYRNRKVQVKITPSFEQLRRYSNESYRAGTAYFTNGAALDRRTTDRSGTLNSMLSVRQFDIGDRVNLSTTLTHILNNDKSDINYTASGKQYHYQRRTSDLSLLVMPEYRYRDVEAGLNMGNKMYHSNTASKDYFFLPSLSGYVQFYSPFAISRTQLKIFGGYNRYCNEPSVHHSYSDYSLTRYSVADAMQYLPLQEVNSFAGLKPTLHREVNAGINFYAWGRIDFSANWFSRLSRDEVFPLFLAQSLTLTNMADLRINGLELEFRVSNKYDKKKPYLTNSAGFTLYRNKTVSVKQGYNEHPVSGFSNVHKSLVAGYAPGVIMGNSWLRNAAGEKIIGADGFPLVNNTLSVIGNPVPDFTLKLNHRIAWKDQWTFFIDWEWQKGGDVWNGTRALLDYYGRSKASGEQRTITNYVFAGVTANGAHNSTPVSFYNPSLPLEQNRWVRYGPAGVAEDYIEDAGSIRINNINISYKPKLKFASRQLSFSLYASNLLLWTPYKGADPRQLLYDMPGSGGLDFFNLPSASTAGFSTTFQF